VTNRLLEFSIKTYCGCWCLHAPRSSSILVGCWISHLGLDYWLVNYEGKLVYCQTWLLCMPHSGGKKGNGLLLWNTCESRSGSPYPPTKSLFALRSAEIESKARASGLSSSFYFPAKLDLGDPLARYCLCGYRLYVPLLFHC